MYRSRNRQKAWAEYSIPIVQSRLVQHEIKLVQLWLLKKKKTIWAFWGQVFSMKKYSRFTRVSYVQLIEENMEYYQIAVWQS